MEKKFKVRQINHLNRVLLIKNTLLEAFEFVLDNAFPENLTVEEIENDIVISVANGGYLITTYSKNNLPLSLA